MNVKKEYPREYRTWLSMRERCMNPNRKDYKYYGGKGVKVCSRWNNFHNFLADLGLKPEGQTLDRIDSDGDYCPENCRWRTQKQQCRNFSRNLHIEYGGKSQCLQAWADELGIPRETIRCRLKAGRPLQQVFEQEHMCKYAERDNGTFI